METPRENISSRQKEDGTVIVAPILACRHSAMASRGASAVGGWRLERCGAMVWSLDAARGHHKDIPVAAGGRNGGDDGGGGFWRAAATRGHRKARPFAAGGRIGSDWQ